MEQLVKQYRYLDRDLALFSDRILSKREFEEKIFMPILSERAGIEKELLELENRIETLEAPDKVFALIKEQMQNFHAGLNMSLKGLYERPYRYISDLVRGVFKCTNQDSRDVEIVKRIILSRTSQVPKLIEIINTNIDGLSTPYLQEVTFACDNLKRTFAFVIENLENSLSGLDEQSLQELKNSIRQTIDIMQAWKQDVLVILKERGFSPNGMTPDDATVKFEEDYYRDILKKQLGVDLDELLSWYEQEVDKTRAEVFKIARNLDIPENNPKNMGEANDILFKYAGPAKDAEQMYERGRKNLAKCQKEARRIVPMPEEECFLKRMPEQIVDSYPWGGYGGGCSYRRPLWGEYYLNQTNVSAVTEGWNKINACHEAYPGHHIQFVRAVSDPLPEVIKIGAMETAITEGVCIRTERLFEYVYADDPFYPLFVAYRRHHTSVRIKVDLWMRYFGKTIGECVQLYIDEMGFDRRTARSQVTAQENQQGYFTSYYYGLKRVEDLEKELGFDKEEYTRLLFDAGRVSLDILEGFLKLSKADKKRYQNDFKSIIQFGE